MEFVRLNPDQARETVNTQQRFSAFLEAQEALRRFRGSMTYKTISGTEYLVRYHYDRNGERKMSSLGPRSEETDAKKLEFEQKREAARERAETLRETIGRQAAVNKALGLGRVPSLNARIVRALDASGLTRNGVRIIGTNCIFAYEAAAGVHVDADVTTTEDIDILMDARASIRLSVGDEQDHATLIKVLRRVDRSFEKTERAFQASNRDGFLVDLVKPAANPPWKKESESVSGDPDDLVAVGIEGLSWQVNSAAFEATAIDTDGFPVRIVAPDPVAFAVHKLWLSEREDRNPLKKGRDAKQAAITAELVSQFMPHLPFDPDRLKQFPKEIVEKAAPLFTGRGIGSSFDW